MGLSSRQIQKADQVRSSILEAAARLIVRSGVNDLTLDAVAKEAGVSKGGLLHHHKNKADLLFALLDLVITDLDERIRRFEAADPDPNGRKIRSYIRATTSDDKIENRRISVALLTAFLFNADLMERWRKHSDEWIDKEFMLKNPLREGLIRSSINGLILSQALGMQEIKGPARQYIIDHLISLTTNN